MARCANADLTDDIRHTLSPWRGRCRLAQRVVRDCALRPSSATSAVQRFRQAGTTAEYKQVTVLFADVVHSMDIAAAVGPERLRELMSDLFDAAPTWYSASAEPSTSSPATA